MPIIHAIRYTIPPKMVSKALFTYLKVIGSLLSDVYFFSYLMHVLPCFIVEPVIGCNLVNEGQ